MAFQDIEKVTYEVYKTEYLIKKYLSKILQDNEILSFDTETRSLYPKNVREEAEEYLKENDVIDTTYKQARLVVASSGLSYPSITRTTHFIFGVSKNKSYIIICNDYRTEMYIWNILATYKGLLLIHNSLFDLKIMYERIKKFPYHYIDTALLAKCLINHVNIWKSKTGLKELMGGYYDPKWSELAEDYEPEDLKNKDFLNYCAIDGAATFYLYELILKQI